MKVQKQTRLYEWQRDNKGKEKLCTRCGAYKEVTVDHIIPVHLLEQLGLEEEARNDEENFELLCRTCNTFKGARIDLAHKKTIPLLKKYINSL